MCGGHSGPLMPLTLIAKNHENNNYPNKQNLLVMKTTKNKLFFHTPSNQEIRNLSTKTLQWIPLQRPAMLIPPLPPSKPNPLHSSITIATQIVGGMRGAHPTQKSTQTLHNQKTHHSCNILLYPHRNLGRLVSNHEYKIKIQSIFLSKSASMRGCLAMR